MEGSIVSLDGQCTSSLASSSASRESLVPESQAARNLFSPVVPSEPDEPGRAALIPPPRSCHVTQCQPLTPNSTLAPSAPQAPPRRGGKGAVHRRQRGAARLAPRHRCRGGAYGWPVCRVLGHAGARGRGGGGSLCAGGRRGHCRRRGRELRARLPPRRRACLGARAPAGPQLAVGPVRGAAPGGLRRTFRARAAGLAHRGRGGQRGERGALGGGGRHGAAVRARLPRRLHPTVAAAVL